MTNLTNAPRNALGDRAGPEWQQFPADAYLDQRHRHWIISEEMGDVRFVPEAGVVLVHRVRAEHVARTLGSVASGVLLEQVLAPPPTTAPEPVPLPAPPAAVQVSEAQSLAASAAGSRWPDLLGWLGIVTGAAVFVAALALPLDDPALVVALMLAVRGGRLMLGPA